MALFVDMPFNEKSLINFTSLIAMRQKEIAKSLIPLSWCLFEPIQILLQLVNMIGMLMILKIGLL